METILTVQIFQDNILTLCVVGLASAEAENPHKSIPKATKQVFWRIALFYVVSLFILGLIVPSDSHSLTMASGGNTRYSPFVLSIQLAGIKVLPSVFNTIITLSVLSVANSCTYGSTRSIHALCKNGMGPEIGKKVDRKGRPWVILIIVLLFGCLAYVSLAKHGSVAFTWLLSIAGLSNFFTWGSICFAHIRFRKAMALQSRSLEELAFTAQFGVIGSWIGLGLNILCLIAQFYLAVSPIHKKPSAENFFQSYLAFPIVILFFIGYKAYYNDWKFGVDLASVNLDEGRRELDIEQIRKEKAEEKLRKKSMPLWKRFL